MRAIFCVPVESGNAVLPPMESDDGYQLLEYADELPRDGSGFSLIGLVPQANVCLVLIDTGEAILALMRADNRFLWLETLNVGAEVPVLPDPTNPIVVDTSRVKAFLIVNEVTESVVNAVEIHDAEDVRLVLQDICGVTDEEYERASKA